jgi:hypothetical protein
VIKHKEENDSFGLMGRGKRQVSLRYGALDISIFWLITQMPARIRALARFVFFVTVALDLCSEPIRFWNRTRRILPRLKKKPSRARDACSRGSLPPRI